MTLTFRRRSGSLPRSVFPDCRLRLDREGGFASHATVLCRTLHQAPEGSQEGPCLGIPDMHDMERHAAQVASGTLSSSSLDRYTCIALAGVAAEYVNFGQAEGGMNDVQQLDSLLKALQVQLPL